MRPLIILLFILLLITAPTVAEKNKGLFSGEILADLDSFTSNVSETPGYLSGNQSPTDANPQNMQDWMDIGKTQLKSGNWKTAEETFAKVIDQEPKNTEGWEGYLLAIRGEGDFEELLEASERATTENPGFASAWKYNGIALSSLDRSEEALAAFDKALEADPGYYTARYYKGIALDSLKRYTESVKAYEEVLAQDARYKKAWNNKGVALTYVGRYDEAITAFDTALSLDPSYTQASQNKGIAVVAKGKKSLTVVDFIDDSSVLNPSSLEIDGEETPVMLPASPTPIPVTTVQTPDIPPPEPTGEPTIVPTPAETPVPSIPPPTAVEESASPVTKSSGTKGGANMFRGNPAHTGEYPGPAPLKGELKWEFETEEVRQGLHYVIASAVAEDMVFIRSFYPYLYALDAETGVEKWKFFAGSGGYQSTITVVDGMVYTIGSNENDVYIHALDAQTGEEKWKYKIKASNGFVVVDSVLYVASDGLYALDAITGALKWKYSTEEQLTSSPAVAEGIVYCVTVNGPIYAISADSGTLKWKSERNIIIVFSSPAIRDNTLFIGGQYNGKENYVFALDAETGILKWKYPTEGQIFSSPAVAKGMVFIGSNDNNLYALDTETGALKWRYETLELVQSSPIVVDDVVFFGSNDQNIYALQATTGTLIKVLYTTEGIPMTSVPTVEKGVLYMEDSDHSFYAIE